MPIIKAQKKSVRQSAKRKVFNDRRRRTMRDAVKAIKAFVAGNDAKSASESLPTAYKAIDKAAKRGVIKANTASRKKSQLSRIIKEIA
ncbi:MAG: 30S ribosomal protein S20 [Minisyncoccia bacterium]